MRLRSLAAIPRIATVLVFLWLSGTVPLHAQANPNQVALLQWYLASTTSSFPTQTAPWGIVYDGANIWVLNSLSNSLSKYRPSDGALLATFTFTQPAQRMAYDGTNLWLVNYNIGSIVKVRPTDGAVLAGTSIAGATGIAFDGTNMWVNGNGNTINQLSVSNMAVLKTVNVSCQVLDLAYETIHIWGVCPSSNQVMKLTINSTTPALQTVGSYPVGLTYDGANMWVANEVSGTVTKVRGIDMAVLGTYAVGSYPTSVEFDGANVWVANEASNTLTKLRASDGTNLGSVSTPSSPVRLAFDGAHIWATHYNANSVGKY
jgi:hypothetical protein